MANEDSSIPRAQRQGIRLNPRLRCGAAALGLVGVGAGGAAVFITHVEAGPAALIVAGVLFLLIAMSGVMPTRLKVGDNEAEWSSEIQEAAAAVALNAAANDQNGLENSLGRLADLSPHVASSVASFMHIARSFGLIEQATKGRDDVKFSIDEHGGAIYMILQASDGNKALVQSLANDDISTTQAKEVLKETLAHANDLAASRILLVLDDEPSGKLRATIDRSPNLVAVIIDNNIISSLGKMIRGIEKLLDLDAD